jgi:hypothetical protein
MPPKRKTRTKRRTQRGGSKFTDFLKKANNTLRNTKAISRVASVLSDVGVPFAGNIGSAASKLGYGKVAQRMAARR